MATDVPYAVVAEGTIVVRPICLFANTVFSGGIRFALPATGNRKVSGQGICCIVYKLAQYNGAPVAKESPEKATVPGRKSLLRTALPDGTLAADRIVPFGAQGDRLLRLERPEEIPVIRQRLKNELEQLPGGVVKLRKPARYPVETTLSGTVSAGGMP